MTTSLVSIAARERGLVGARIRRRSLALQVGVVAVWSAGSIALTLTLLALSGSHSQISGIVFAMISFTALGPLASSVGRVIKQRASAAQMALITSEDPALDALPVALRGLLADGRLVRSAIEGQAFDPDVALRSVYEWLHRYAALPEKDRARLVDLGLGRLDVDETLRWTIAEPGRIERGLATVAEQLGVFERVLLAAARGPYR